MRNIKKFLYGFMVTSFVVIGSVNVFAAGFGGTVDKVVDAGESIVKCLETQDITGILT